MIVALHSLVYCGLALSLLTSGGNWLCRQLFTLTGLKDATAEGVNADQPAGRIIGSLERLVLALGIVMHSWEVLAAVIALKTVARFKELDDQRFAEYFLVGSLFSMLWAVLMTGVWLAYDRHLGVDIRGLIIAAIEPTQNQSKL